MFNTLAKKVAETTTEIASEVVTEVTSEVASEGAASLSFSTENLSEALLCSAAGMIGIFIVVGIIILSVSVLNKLGAKKDK